MFYECNDKRFIISPDFIFSFIHRWKLCLYSCRANINTIQRIGISKYKITQFRCSICFLHVNNYNIMRSLICFSQSMMQSVFFVCDLSSHSRMFTHKETSPVPVKGCKFWPMLGTHGHWAVSVPHLLRRGPNHDNEPETHTLPSVWQWSCHFLFIRLRSVATGDRTPISSTRGRRSTYTPPRRYEYNVHSACFSNWFLMIWY